MKWTPGLVVALGVSAVIGGIGLLPHEWLSHDPFWFQLVLVPQVLAGVASHWLQCRYDSTQSNKGE